jgi:putative membrane protein
MKFVGGILVSAVNAFALAYVLKPHIEIRNIGVAIMVAFLLALLNSIVRPILILLTLPATVITLGLFLLIINAGIIMIDDALVKGFKVESFWYALLFSLLLSLMNSFVHRLIYDQQEKAEEKA